MVRAYRRKTSGKTFKVYVDTGESVWSTNQLEFDTSEEAKEYGSNLQSRWMLVRKFAVVEVPEEFGSPWLKPEQVKQMEVQ